MLKEGMLVRCPADVEDEKNPRVFVCGKIMYIDEFSKTAKVLISDPFNHIQYFESLPRDYVSYDLDQLVHCNLFAESVVLYSKKKHTVLSYKSENEYYYYFLEREEDKRVFYVCERDIEAAFNNGHISPLIQLSTYEFQHPCWYFGRSVVSKNINILENSMKGFKELAGSKIYLLPHQINTIMRCLQTDYFRYMLADEVGMGKTIEASSILKIYLSKRSKVKILIAVPRTLTEQWRLELFLKFNISIGMNPNNNQVFLVAVEDLSKTILSKRYDVLVVDEVHKYLQDEVFYTKLHQLSESSKSVLLLSATPVQQRYDEYLKLLRLLEPATYDHIQENAFANLVNKQSVIIEEASLILDDIQELHDLIRECEEEDEDPHNDECEGVYEDIYESLADLCEKLEDEQLQDLLEQVSFDADDLGISDLKIIISYICAHYQIESNIIRNRRRILETNDEDDDQKQIAASRELKEVPYELDKDLNYYEALVYEELLEWMDYHIDKTEESIKTIIIPLLSSFFSSPWAFVHLMNKLGYSSLPHQQNWLDFEESIVEDIEEILNDPDYYREANNTRLVKVLTYIFDEIYEGTKIVLFTNYDETFTVYKRALTDVFSDEVCFFSKRMDKEEIENNVYKFQNNREYNILLCDASGGEGRNFQCADYVIHIDLPWDANIVEQRIGRLDRLDRNPNRNVVYSVVPYAVNTIEENLFKFWRDGLKVFTHSLSGMEIIMGDINAEIVKAMCGNLEEGLFDHIPKIINLANNMIERVRREQNFDVAAYLYEPMQVQLKKLLDYYTENDNALFAHSMLSWANLAGFTGQRERNNVVSFNRYSFSPRSAINSQLIPPQWNNYMMSKQNQFLIKVQSPYDQISKDKRDRSIKGTFIRKNAIENDYLRFFAPGDEVFDCIVNNAINSCKGTATAMAVKSKLEWKGIVLVWNIKPDITRLLESGLSIYALSPYRGFIDSRQIVTVHTISAENETTDSEVIREYNRIIRKGYIKKSVVHLGSRSKKRGFLYSIDRENIQWFKTVFPKEKWKAIIRNCRNEGYNKVKQEIKKYSDIRGVKEEMERRYSLAVSNSRYFDKQHQDLQTIKSNNEIIYETLRGSKLSLESAAFIWMVKSDDVE